MRIETEFYTKQRPAPPTDWMALVMVLDGLGIYFALLTALTRVLVP